MNDNLNVPIATKIRTGAGKGDANRVADRATFAANYDQIDWRKKFRCPSCKEIIDPETCSCGEPIPGHCDNHSPVPQGCVCCYDRGGNDPDCSVWPI